MKACLSHRTPSIVSEALLLYLAQLHRLSFNHTYPKVKGHRPAQKIVFFLILKVNRSLCVLYLNKCKLKSLYKKPMNLQNLFTQEKQIENVNMLFFIFVSYIKHLFSHWFAYDWEGNLFVGETEMLSIIDKVHFKDEKSCLFFLQLQVKKNAQFVYTNAATL